MKKGFTLIELIISLSLMLIVASAELTTMEKYMNIYKKTYSLNKEFIYVNEALFFIENEIDESQYVRIEDNRIILGRKNISREDCIELNNNKNIVIRYGNSNNNNNVVKGVKDFFIEKYGNVIYITIVGEKGKRYERCFGIIQKE